MEQFGLFQTGMVAYPEDVADFFSIEDIVSGATPAAFPAGELSEEGLLALSCKQHTGVVGRTGCGKTSSVIAPAMLLAAHSSEKPNVVCVDVKPTTRILTERAFRSQGYRVLAIDLRDCSQGGDSWNPLDECQRALRAGDHSRFEESADLVLNAMADMVVNEQDRYWTTQMKQLLKALIEGLCLSPAFANEPLGLNHLYEYCVSGRDSLLAVVKGHSGGWADALRSICRLPIETTFPCVIGVTTAALRGFAGKSLAESSSRSTFTVEEDFVNCAKPTALFLCCPEEKEGVHQYAALLLNDVIAKLITAAEEGGPSFNLETHVFIDEFGLLPRCIVASEIAASRSRALFFHLSFQSTSQLRDHYTPDQVKTLVQQLQCLMLMSNEDTDLLDVEVALNPVLTPGLISSLPSGVAIVRQCGKPLFRAELSPYEAYGRLGLASESPADDLFGQGGPSEEAATSPSDGGSARDFGESPNKTTPLVHKGKHEAISKLFSEIAKSPRDVGPDDFCTALTFICDCLVADDYDRVQVLETLLSVPVGFDPEGELLRVQTLTVYALYTEVSPKLVSLYRFCLDCGLDLALIGQMILADYSKLANALLSHLVTYLNDKAAVSDLEFLGLEQHEVYEEGDYLLAETVSCYLEMIQDCKYRKLRGFTSFRGGTATRVRVKTTAIVRYWRNISVGWRFKKVAKIPLDQAVKQLYCSSTEKRAAAEQRIRHEAMARSFRFATTLPQDALSGVEIA